MFTKWLDTFNELNDAEKLKKTVTASLNEIKKNVNLDDLVEYAGKAGKSPVLRVISPRSARNLLIAAVVVERATAAYTAYQKSQVQQPLDYSLNEQIESQATVDYALVQDQNTIAQENEDLFWEQERLDYDNLQHDQQQYDATYNQAQDDFAYHEMQMDYASEY